VSTLTPGSFSAATNRITEAGYGYDGAGNLTSYAGRTLEYDAENRQTALTESGTMFEHRHDGDGRRVKKVVNGLRTVYVYDAGGALAAEYSETANTESGTQFLTADHLGSTRLVTDAAGAPVHDTDYYPFGEEIGGGDWITSGSVTSARRRAASPVRTRMERGLLYSIRKVGTLILTLRTDH